MTTIYEFRLINIYFHLFFSSTNEVWMRGIPCEL